MPATAKEMTTSEVSKSTGISANVLRNAARDGWVTPRTEGVGQGKRLFWSSVDVKAVRDLIENQESGKSAAEAFLDSLGGPEFVGQMERARKIKDSLRGDQVVIVGIGSIRAAQRTSVIREAISKVTGDIAVILL